MTTVDTWAAQISVAEVTLSAEVTYLDPATGQYQATPPSVNIGGQIAVKVRVSNNSGYSLWTRADLTFRKPDGTLVPITGPTVLIDTGYFFDTYFTATADQVGTWQHNLGVYAGLRQDAMSLTISRGWTTAATVVAVPAGTITSVEFQDPVTGAWSASAPAYIVGHTMGVRAYAHNESGVPMTARMDLVVTDPDGVETTYTGSEVSQAVDETGYWTFSVPLDKAGTWSLTFKLYGAV